MTADRRLPADLLTESEATLRLVDTLLEELGALDEDVVAASGGGMMQVLGYLAAHPPEVSNLSAVFLRVYVAVVGALGTLRRTRGELERATIEHVQATQETLREVGSTTELAAVDLLDGLDRALALIDRLDSLADGGESGKAAASVRRDLRDELYQMIGGLQFQDIASQQLSHAASVLRDMEQRLEAVVLLFDASKRGSDVPAAEETSAAGDAVFDPGASLRDAAPRQALADEIFTDTTRARDAGAPGS